MNAGMAADTHSEWPGEGSSGLAGLDVSVKHMGHGGSFVCLLESSRLRWRQGLTCIDLGLDVWYGWCVRGPDALLRTLRHIMFSAYWS